jgi:16S rRNA (cytosine1402-N4)-methyltransferase
MAKTAEKYHVPVLLKASVDGLDIKPDGTYVDVTFGGGGHSREILSRLGKGGRLFGFDQDADAENNVKTLYAAAGPDIAESRERPEFIFVRSNFRYLKNWMRYHGVDHIDGLLGDLGVSSHHFDDESRGFSFRFDAPLDMRMNKRAGKTAADIVNEYDETRLADVFYLYGELRTSRRIAAVLVKARQQKPIATTHDLMEAVEPLFHRDREKKDLARLFQALRIEVNHEMDALREMLTSATDLLAPGGRLSIITYHSLEDRIVKNVMKTGRADGKVEQDFFGRVECPYRMVTSKVITPTDEEQQDNPRSRSAKLRIAEKI